MSHRARRLAAGAGITAAVIVAGLVGAATAAHADETTTSSDQASGVVTSVKPLARQLKAETHMAARGRHHTHGHKKKSSSTMPSPTKPSPTKPSPKTPKKAARNA